MKGAPPGRPRKLSQEREVELADDYRKGMPIKALEAKYGVTKPSLYAALDRQKEPRAAKRPEWPPAETHAPAYDGPERRRA